MKEIDNSGSEIFPLREPIAGVKHHGKLGASALLAKALLSVAAAGLVTLAVLTGSPEKYDPAVYGELPPSVEDPGTPLPPEDPEVKPPVKPPVKKDEISPPPTTPPPTTPPPTTPPPTTPPPTTPPPTTPPPTTPPPTTPPPGPPYIPYDPPVDPPPITPPPTTPPPFVTPTLTVVYIEPAAPDGEEIYVRATYDFDLGDAEDATIRITADLGALGSNFIDRYTHSNLTDQFDEIVVSVPMGTLIPDFIEGTLTFTVSYEKYGSPESFTLGPYPLPF